MKKRAIVLLVLFLYPPSLFAFHGLTVNGDSVLTITVLDPVLLSGYFSSDTHAVGSFYLDINNDGTVDPGDILVRWQQLFDGSWQDMDETVNGFYSDADTSGVPFSGDIIFEANDNGGSDQVVVHSLPLSTGHSISGQITYPVNAEGLLVVASPSSSSLDRIIGDFSDSNGDYHIGIPDTMINRYWYVACLDLAVTRPFHIEPFVDSVYVNGAELLDIQLEDSDLSCIRGVIQDDQGNPLPDEVTVQVMGGWLEGIDLNLGSNIARTSGGTGAYASLTHYAFLNGWSISVPLEELYPLYLVPPSIDTVHSAPQETLSINFTAYRTTVDIQGTVYVDDDPEDFVLIHGLSVLGDNRTRSYSDGHYRLPVSPASDSYQVMVDSSDIPPGGYVAEGIQTVPPGASGVDFHIYSAGVKEERDLIPVLLHSLDAFPIPFTSKIVIECVMGSTTKATVSVYDATGRHITRLSRAPLRAGRNVFTWDGTGENSLPVPSGVYFLKVEAGASQYTRKVLLVR